MRKKNDRAFWESARDNDITFIHYYNRLTELAISMFKWENLPDTIDERFLELTLFADGMAIFFEDEVMGYLALQSMIGGNLDVYRIPRIRRAYAVNGYNRKLNENDSVIIFNNMLHTNCLTEVEMFAKRLYNCARTIDININAQKTPVMIVCPENQRLTMSNLYMQWEGNRPVIFGSKDMDRKSLEVLKTDAPYVADKIQQTKTEIWNEALTYLGISNTNVNKKERLISDEVTRNMGSTVASRYSRLEMRKQACEKINKMFGLNVDVKYREDVVILADQLNPFKEGDDNE